MPDSDVQLYVNSMARIRERIDFIQALNVNQINIPSTAFKGEFMFLQFRKVLEEIAFSTIATNKDTYSALHANFSVHWKARGILEEVKKLNAEFYPIPLQEPISAGNNQHFELVTDGFMTPEEFVTLYQVSSEVLHSRNPYKQGDPTIQAKYTVQEWVSRIQKLLALHRVQLLNGDMWIVNIPQTEKVKAFPASPASAATV
jgi:hypothetical protein